MKIIVVTPVKNEEWVIRTFLEVTSQFADSILIADQNSDDNTVLIARSFPKVNVLANPSAAYNNSTRQKFLIDKARELHPGNNIIIALDADEVLAAGSLNTAEWNEIKQLPAGTLLYFKKTDLIEKGSKVLHLADAFFPLGFIDDGKMEHKGKPMHSVRVPISNQSQQAFKANEIFFLHLQRLRPQTQEAKRRFYQVKEKDFAMNPWYWRRKRYRKADFLGLNFPTRPTPESFVDYPPELNVDFGGLLEKPDNWFDKEVFVQLAKNGSFHYWFEDIWDKDWKQYGLERKMNIKITPPPDFFRKVLKIADWLFDFLYKFKQKLAAGS